MGEVLQPSDHLCGLWTGSISSMCILYWLFMILPILWHREHATLSSIIWDFTKWVWLWLCSSAFSQHIIITNKKSHSYRSRIVVGLWNCFWLIRIVKIVCKPIHLLNRQGVRIHPCSTNLFPHSRFRAHMIHVSAPRKLNTYFYFFILMDLFLPDFLLELLQSVMCMDPKLDNRRKVWIVT